MWRVKHALRPRLLAEFTGTFLLVFIGAGAIVVNELFGGPISHVGVALTFGLVVASVIYALGEVSGAHINPAVTLGFWWAGRFPRRDVLPYVSCQLLGAAAASGLLLLLFQQPAVQGQTVPAGPAWQSFALETLLTFLLMLTIIAVATGAREKGVNAGLAVGGVVALAALFGGPVSGASMNPARSFGPALTSGAIGVLWIYLLAPVLGAALAVYGCRAMRGRECCQ